MMLQIPTYLAHTTKRRFLDYVKLGNIKEANAFGYIQQQIKRWTVGL
ncbi:MAG: hypothetical protein WKG06_36655 [Segetibacter sp.]